MLYMRKSICFLALIFILKISKMPHDVKYLFDQPHSNKRIGPQLRITINHYYFYAYLYDCQRRWVCMTSFCEIYEA